MIVTNKSKLVCTTEIIRKNTELSNTYGYNFHRCGDCDDFATLFAGLMYASGVPKNKVWVVCGTVPEGWHCWDWLALSGQTYRVDPVCSQKQSLVNLFGLKLFTTQGAYYTSTKSNVQCFSEYNEQMKMNPKGVYLIN